MRPSTEFKIYGFRCFIYLTSCYIALYAVDEDRRGIKSSYNSQNCQKKKKKGLKKKVYFMFGLACFQRFT